jgi:hypothetical protein
LDILMHNTLIIVVVVLDVASLLNACRTPTFCVLTCAAFQRSARYRSASSDCNPFRPTASVCVDAPPGKVWRQIMAQGPRHPDLTGRQQDR